MTLLFRLIYAAHCRSTHHKLAMDALRWIKSPSADNWRSLFLKYHRSYLQGAKAPDTDFKDFRNHVLHVRENYWGGAIKAAQTWYDRTVELLREENWQEAVYAAGVLSHYYTDPIMPFHTGQSQEESNIHRAAEWSVAKSYDDLRRLLEHELERPPAPAPRRDQWLAEMVQSGAEFSNPHYETLIEHYDFDCGVKDPPAGWDQVSREILAQLLGYAASGFAAILDRAFDESGATPPEVDLTVAAFLATLETPVKWVVRKLADAKERALVETIYEELQETGKVEQHLPEDDRAVRDLHAKEVLGGDSQTATKTNSPVYTPSAKPAKTAELRHYLSLSEDIEQAPSIGGRTAQRLQKVGVFKVADLLNADADDLAARIEVRYITSQLIVDWQAQARLVCQIPHLRGHDAQLLVACGYREPAAVAREEPKSLLAKVEPFAATSAGQRILRSSKPPDLAEVSDWIQWSQQARSLKAA